MVVPEEVCVATDAQVGVGEARTFDLRNGGVDVDLEDRPDAAADATRLLVTADVGVGSLRIGQSGTDLDFGRGHFDRRELDFGRIEDELGRNSGCAA